MTSMNVSLTDELVRIVQRKVESGLYNNASEVIREAIRRIDSNEDLIYELKLLRLKEALAPAIADWQEGRFADHSLARIKHALDAQ